MIVQKDDMAVQINKAKQKGLPVAVGGPFASSTPDAPELDLADFKILDEGEITLLEQFIVGPGPQRALPRVPLDCSAGNPRTAGIASTGGTHGNKRTAARLIVSPGHRPCHRAGTARPSATPSPGRGHGRGN